MPAWHGTRACDDTCHRHIDALGDFVTDARPTRHRGTLACSAGVAGRVAAPLRMHERIVTRRQAQPKDCACHVGVYDATGG